MKYVAPAFERRAGLPEDVAYTIAQALRELTQLDPEKGLLEIGCGSGQLGRHLHQVSDYLGIDTSQGMLDLFQQRCPAARILNADANDSWPVEQVHAVFGSRVLDRLHPEHLDHECRRTTTWLVRGRVQKGPDTLHHLMRKAMRLHVPEAPEPAPRGGDVVATWSVRENGARIIQGWREGPGLAAVDLAPQRKAEILESLRVFEAEERDSTYQYVLEAVRPSS